MFAIIKKELKIYFNSPIAYIFIIAFLSIGSWLFFRTFFFFNQADMRNYFNLLPWIFIFLIPAMTMRLFSEEKRSGTMETLATLPIKNHEIVLGKFFASLFFLALSLILTSIIPISIGFIGNPDGGVIIASYIGALLMGAAFLSLGLWISNLNDNQIVSFILTVTISFFLLILGNTLVTYSLPSFISPVFEYLGLGNHFDSISKGVIDTRDLIYYISIIFIFLFLTTKSVENRRFK